MLRRRHLALALACPLSLVGGAGSADAGPDSEVASAADPGDPIDLHASVDYAYAIDQADIVRERAGLPGTLATDPIPKIADLHSRSVSHTITPHIDLGIFRDTWVSVGLPIIIAQRRELTFADGVDASNSSTVLDGILASGGFDANDPNTGLPVGDLIFRGPSRAGLDQVHLGLGVAPMNQRRDDTKPTWKIGIEFRVAVGAPAKLDPANPNSELGVGSGVHELRAWTSIARRLGRFEPYFGLDWRTPLAVTSDSAFKDPGFGARRTKPQTHASGRTGFEFIVLDKPADRTRLSTDLGLQLAADFEGRAYSEMWEVFALAGTSGAGGPLILDGDPTANGLQPLSHPGVTQVENALRMDAHLLVRAELGPNIQISAGMNLGRASAHAISFGDAGVDQATCGDGQTSGCESDTNELVTPGTREVNPLYVDLIDLVGHRYRAESAWNVRAMVTGTMLF